MTETGFRGTLYAIRGFRHIHHDGKGVDAAAHDHPFNRGDVAVIPSPSENDVTLTGNQIVGGVQINPTDIRHKKGKPGV